MNDIRDIPKELRRKLTFTPVTNMREVIEAALVERPLWRLPAGDSSSPPQVHTPAAFRDES
jgi:hypothetical protein